MMTDTAPDATDLLDRAIRAVNSQAAPPSARQQAIEKAVAARAVPFRAPARPLSPFRAAIIRWAIAACLFLVMGVIVLPSLQHARKQSAANFTKKEVEAPAAIAPRQDAAGAAYKWRSNNHAVVAQPEPLFIPQVPARPGQPGRPLP